MPKIVNHKLKRRELAKAAVEVISNIGIENLRLVDVAREIVATTSMVTRYLGDKDAVLSAALDYVAAELLSHEPKSMSVVELWSLLYEVLPVDTYRRNHWKVWLAYWSRAANSSELAKIQPHYNDQFKKNLLMALAPHDLPENGLSREEVADAVCTTIDGIAANATVEPRSWSATKQRRQLTILLTPILGAPK